MRHTIYIPVLATLFLLAVSMSNAQPLKSEKPGPSKPAPKTLDPRMEKLKALGEHLGGALEIALDLFSGNKADLFSGNEAALLSGNKAAFLSGNAPKILSENQTPIFSGNKISLFSNFKVEIHIENSGNHEEAPRAAKPTAAAPVIQPSIGNFTPSMPIMTLKTATATPATSSDKPSTSKEVEQPSGTIYFPPPFPSGKP
jgi:hypothetical protein